MTHKPRLAIDMDEVIADAHTAQVCWYARNYGNGKMGPRLLSEADPSLSDQFNEAFRALFMMGKVESLVALAEAELSPHGGSSVRR